MTCLRNSNSMELSCSNKVNDLERNLHKSLVVLKELKSNMEEICLNSENYKSQFLTQKEKCESKNCISAEILNKEIEAKNKIIQLVASSISKLSETKNFAIIEDIFKILCEETDITISPKYKKPDIKIEKQTPEKVNESIAEDVSFNDSENDVEHTPTGRISPIIQPRKVKSKGNDAPYDYRDKKKCPDSWPTPEKKFLKLLYPTQTKGKGVGKVRQMRLSYVKMKQTSVVDLTCSSEFNGGLNCTRSVTSGNLEPLLVKRKSSESDTIMPSPTSGPNNFTMFKSATNESPVKFRKPLSLTVKRDKENNSRLEEIRSVKKEIRSEEKCLKDSVNLFKEESHESPNKQQPLVENVNLENILPNEDMESSVSLLKPELKILKTDDTDNVQRKITLPNKEPIYKESMVRKKSEKRALPGWICEECKNFYGVLYEDNPLMLEKMIAECSKHRGKRNPVRPKTPPNFWNPRWDVPKDTEELNRMNNAI